MSYNTTAGLRETTISLFGNTSQIQIHFRSTVSKTGFYPPIPEEAVRKWSCKTMLLRVVCGPISIIWLVSRSTIVKTSPWCDQSYECFRDYLGTMGLDRSSTLRVKLLTMNRELRNTLRKFASTIKKVVLIYLQFCFSFPKVNVKMLTMLNFHETLS